jgi:hypothetical protein
MTDTVTGGECNALWFHTTGIVTMSVTRYFRRKCFELFFFHLEGGKLYFMLQMKQRSIVISSDVDEANLYEEKL